jgi:hypothetical protein
MQITKEKLLQHLPPYRDEWLTITKSQDVYDIIKEILKAHNLFASNYNEIALFFDGLTTEQICNNIFSFLKNNIRYKEETEASQTTAVPAGILTRGHGDCKHYASFAAGILDALNRLGKKIDWNYRFVSYDLFNSNPYHVFIVVKNKNGKETWIDPTPGANNVTPVWYIDKKIKNMAIKRNIAGIGDVPAEQTPALYPVYWFNGSWYATPHQESKIGVIDDIIETGISIISNLSNLFSGSNGPRAASKIYSMFPLPPTGATASQVQDTINAIQAHHAQDTGADSEWQAAYSDILSKYNQVLSIINAGHQYALKSTNVPTNSTSSPVMVVDLTAGSTMTPGTPTTSSLQTQPAQMGFNWTPILLIGGGLIAAKALKVF